MQALKYLLQDRLTKSPMTLSLGRTYVWWCPMTFSLVWLGNKSEWHKLISAQCINGKCCEDSKPKLTWLPITVVRIRQVKPVFHFTTLLAAPRLTSLQFWTRVHFETPSHSGRTNNKSQFHECPVVSSLRRTISRMGRTMSVIDRYFTAWYAVVWFHPPVFQLL
jgi:hypothetical protein